MVFPGQGSQSVGMLRGYEGLPEVEKVRTEVAQVLGSDFLQLLDEGPAEKLNQTVNTQPAMVTAGYAAYRAWRALGGAQPEVVAGHSLGEYTALVAAGAIAFRDAVPLVRYRAQAMQDAVPAGVGAMAAILGLDSQAVRDACIEVAAATGEAVEAVNFNDPKQTVIAGTKAGVEKACELLKAKGAKRALPLPVSAPFHSSLMKPAADRLRERLAATTFATPRIPVVNNIDVAVETDATAIRDALYRQAFGPVRWVETVQAIRARGVTHLIECGPGKVLAGMVKRIDAEAHAATLHDPASMNDVKGVLA